MEKGIERYKDQFTPAQWGASYIATGAGGYITEWDLLRASAMSARIARIQVKVKLDSFKSKDGY